MLVESLPGPLTLLYQDDEFVAIDKPGWSVVHRTRGAEDAPILCDQLRSQLQVDVFPIHRLDRQTSGVLVFAKDARTAQILGDDLREGRWTKQYLALCRGPITDDLTIDHPVGDGKKLRPALTLVVPIETFCNRFSLVRATAATGRRHQIRYHLKHLKHPLVGDTNYGQGPINRFFRAELGLGRLFLHAEQLTLVHPRRAERIVICAPLPAELADVLTRLRALPSVPV